MKNTEKNLDLYSNASLTTAVLTINDTWELYDNASLATHTKDAFGRWGVLNIAIGVSVAYCIAYKYGHQCGSMVCTMAEALRSNNQNIEPAESVPAAHSEDITELVGEGHVALEAWA